MNITSAEDIEESNITYLLYSAPGIGKTYTINFLKGKTLYIAIDKTQYPLKGNADIDIVEFNTHNAWDEWKKLMKWLGESDLSSYDNIVFDNMSELTNAMLGDLGRQGKNNRTPEMQHYQQIDFFIIDSVRFINSLGKKVVFLAWEMTDEFNTPGGQIFNRAFPDLRKKILSNFMGLTQVTARMVKSGKTGERGFILEPSNAMFCKNQMDNRTFSLQQDIFTVGNVEVKEEVDQD